MMRMIRCIQAAAAGAALLAGAAAAATPRPNVLFIAVDDLRCALGCYGDPVAVTPHIDRLAERGMVFRRAYCQQAVCNPSRASLMTGRRPDTIKVWDLKTHFRDAIPDIVTLPQYFKNHGYWTRSIGKVYHGNGRPAKDPPSWSEPPLEDVRLDAEVRYATPHNLEGKGLKRDATEAADVPDNHYIDGIVGDEAIQALRALKRKGKPFFLAVGFRKPHLPFCAPKKYWDLYDPAKIPLPVPAHHPEGAPELAVRSWKEVEGYRDIPDDGRFSEKQIRRLRHGYYACVSFTDAQVGRLLDELDRLQLTNRTVVILWGDHGYQIGEQGLWTKANNYELATRAPLILSVPGQPNAGGRCDALVEFVDIYPTLADICGLPAPPGVEGISMKPLLENPGRPWKKAAFSEYPRDRTSNRHHGHGDFMGYAVRTTRYRYVEWREWTSGKVVARELYDHEYDPLESKNLAAEPARQGVLEKLSRMLRAGWRAALPPQP